jgi:hypothetical protein
VNKLFLLLLLATTGTSVCSSSCTQPAKKPAWSDTTLKQVVAMQKIYDNASILAQWSANMGYFCTYSTIVKNDKNRLRTMQKWLLKDPDLLAKTIIELDVIIKDPELSKQFAAAVKAKYDSPNIIL